MIEFIDSAQYTKKNGKQYTGFAIVMELAPNGEIFEHIAETGPFTEALARTFFHQLIESY